MAKATSGKKPVRKAVMDFGTNTFHLFVVDVFSEGSFKKILHRKITVKIGQGGIHKGFIADEAMKRAMRAVSSFSVDLKKLIPAKVSAFGTSAIRDASNGSVFSKAVKSEFNINLQVIDGDREAELIATGVRAAVPSQDVRYMIMDIGGGSTEFIITDHKKSFWRRSYKLGSSFLLEHFRPQDPLSYRDVRNMHAYFEESLSELIRACDRWGPQFLVGSAGSFETFASMIYCTNPDAGRHYGKKHHSLDRQQLMGLCDMLISSAHADRLRMKGLLKMRVDMIVPAALLLRFVVRRLKFKKIELSSYALKEGALLTI